MNKEQTIELAKQAGWTELGADLWGATHDGAMSTYALQRFAALVRADTALEAEPTPVQECGYDETTGTCTRNPCCAVEPAVGACSPAADAPAVRPGILGLLQRPTHARLPARRPR